MEDTRQRIKEYTGRLVRLREKVVAVALLLVISASMLTTVSFAWLALSTNPEVSNVSTNIAANGNLEIALASGTMDDPTVVGPSKAGDSNLPTLERNITWGNLIDLSDPAYALDRLVLRPAVLNQSDLQSRPLHGPVYDATGRFIGTDTSFGYAKLLNGVLTSTNDLGVRAITSMTLGEAGAVSVYNNKLIVVDSANAGNKGTYQGLANNKSYMDALASMMTGYMVENVLKVNSSVGNYVSDSTLKGSDLTQFALMYDEMIQRYEEQAIVFASLLNLYAEVNAYDAEKQAVVGTPTSITGAELLALEYDVTNKTAYNKLATQFGLLANGKYTGAKKGFIIAIDQFLYDYDLMVEDAKRIKTLRDDVNSRSGQSILWKNCPTVANSTVKIIDDIINRFTDVKKCKIYSSAYPNGLNIGSVGAGAALELAKDLCETKITNGILYNFDTFTGARIRNPEGKPLTLSVKAMGMTQSIKSNVSTSADDDYFENEHAVLEEVIKTKIGQPTLIAEDSYGFAVDFWVRTNAKDTFLMLQGNVLTETEIVEVKDKGLNGVEVQIYTISVKAETGEETDPAETTAPSDGGILDNLATATYDVYMSTDMRQVVDENGNSTTEEVQCWRYADMHTVVPDEYVAEYNFEDKLPPKKIEEIEHVLGFEGENRVWDDSGSFLTVNSTTQGSGSCYVFYSENPIDQARILVLLKSMKVAFVDAQGNLLAKAHMDTERHYATTGKVIVPLVLDSTSTVVDIDEDGNVRYAITALERNVATLITAVFYLDGEEITNGDVLAAADIRGQMNLQFGSSVSLNAMKDETLYNAELVVTGEIDGKTEFEYGVDTDLTAKVKVRVSGDAPNSMMAYFIRKISSTQGSPEESFILTDSDRDGIWEGSYTFAYPGEYILRSVQINGTDRELSNLTDQFPTVKVNGFSISRVTYSEADGTEIMTDAASYSVDVDLLFATTDRSKMPNTVVGQFMRGDGAVATVRFRYDATTGIWRGKAVFVSSGEYTMEFVELDGQYTPLGEDQTCTLDLTLGMYVEVETTSPSGKNTMIFGDPATPSSLQMQVGIYDNNGDPIRSLGRAGLNYTAGGSTNLYTALTWNSEEEYYEGEFRVEAGIWRFQNVKITMGEGDGKTNTLTSVKGEPPDFTVIPPTPPTQKELTTVGAAAQYVQSGNGSVLAALLNSEAATVYAKLVDLDDGNVVYVPANQVSPDESTEEADYIYQFPIESSGRWRLESISAFNVFDAQSVLHSLPADGVNSEEAYVTGLVFGIADNSVAVLKASDVSVSVAYADGAFPYVEKGSQLGAFGKDASGSVTGEFMTQQTLKAGSVTITFDDPDNLISRGFFSVSDVSLQYLYGTNYNNSKYGGYTSTAASGAVIDDVAGKIEFQVSDTDKTLFTQSNALTFTYAAQYKPGNLAYTIKAGNASYPVSNKSVRSQGVYTIEVWSKAPTVLISAITPTDSKPAKITYTTKNLAWYQGGGTQPTFTATGNQTSSIDTATNTATIYAVATADNSTQRHGSFTRPTVTVTVAGVDSSSVVSFTLPAGSASAIEFSRTGNGTITKTLGRVSQLKSWTSSVVLTHTLDAYYGHGSQTITDITIVRNGVTFNVTLDKPIVINNPSSVNQQ